MAGLKPPLIGYSLWLEPAGEELQVLQSLIDDLARRYSTSRFGAHLIVLGLLDRKPEELEDLEEVTRNAAERTAPFSMEIIGVAARDAYFQALFLPVVPSPELLDLHSRIARIFERTADPPYMPHFSALYGDVDRDVKQQAIYDVLQTISFPLTVTAASLTLMDVYGNPDEWKVVVRAPLRGS